MERDFAHRELRITDKVLDKYGYTPHCPGCAAKLGGPTTNRGHTAECRQRIYDAMDKEEDGRSKLEAVKKRMKQVPNVTDPATPSHPAVEPADEPKQDEEEMATTSTSRSRKRGPPENNEPDTQDPDPEDDGDAAMGGSTTTVTTTISASLSSAMRIWTRT